MDSLPGRGDPGSGEDGDSSNKLMDQSSPFLTLCVKLREEVAGTHSAKAAEDWVSFNDRVS